MLVTKEVIDTIRKQFITLDELAYIYAIATGQQWDLDINVSSIHKLSTLDLLVGGEITENGALLLASIYPEVEVKTGYTPEFEEFWRTYPTTTETGRFLKRSKKDGFLAYQSAIKKGFLPGDILRALKKELAMKVVAPEGLKYMKNLVNYLNSEQFTALMDEDVKTRKYGQGLL